MSAGNPIPIVELRIGDAFVWCERRVTVLEVVRGAHTPRRPVRGPGRRFKVRLDDGTEKTLHYFDDEAVVPDVG